MMAVLAIAALLLVLAANSVRPDPMRAALDQSAARLLEYIREAERLARHHHSPTRMVFLKASDLAEEGRQTQADPDAFVEVRLYRFVVPVDQERVVQWRLAGETNAVRGGDALERMPVLPPGLPECLIGQWQPVAIKPLRFTSSQGIQFIPQAEFLDQFKNLTPEAYAAAYGWSVPHHWEAGGVEPWTGKSQTSVYPPHYHLTPFPHAPQMVHAPLPASAKVFDPQSRCWRPATDYWPATKTLTHFELSGNSMEFIHRPYLEFSPNGECQSQDVGVMEIRLEVKNRPQLYLNVRWLAETGRGQIAFLP
jgi:type II secretory pathway pseudopilin PulG